MSEERIERSAASTEKEPIFFEPKRVSMISDTASILSWFVLVLFVGDVIAEIIGLRAQLVQQGARIGQLVGNPNLYTYIFPRMVTPLLTGLALFAILQGISIGLSMLLEWDYTMREAKQ